MSMLNRATCLSKSASALALSRALLAPASLRSSLPGFPLRVRQMSNWCCLVSSFALLSLIYTETPVASSRRAHILLIHIMMTMLACHSLQLATQCRVSDCHRASWS